MKQFVLKTTKKRFSDQFKNTIPFEKEYSFYPEEYFRGMISIERRRAERSKKKFILTLINIGKLSKLSTISKNIIKIINASTREIDIKGWFKHNQIIGILFTEIRDTDKVLLFNKIKNSIKDSISPEHYSLITFELYFFPEDDQREKEEIKKNSILYDEPVYSFKSLLFKTSSITFKRMLDIILSITGIALSSPLFLIIPLLIKTTSKGPIFFRQKRMGKNGKMFTFIKFRTMRVNNDASIHREFVKQFIQGANKGAATKIIDDPRVTKIGKFLRKTSLDELPQFFNVLWGDMSIVGPRPAIPYEVYEYETWHKRRVLEVKPGIIGLWQVKGKSRTDFDNMVRLDIQYIRDWSPLLDLKLILKTPVKMFFKKGAC